MTTTVAALLLPAWFALAVDRPASAPLAKIDQEFSREIRPVLQTYCLKCHSTEKKEGELDLEQFASLADIRRQVRVWQKVAEMLDQGEMPPQDAKQPSADQRRTLRAWVRRYLEAESRANAGDPGPVVLRRLSNVEYTNSVRDLTGVALDPAREFPVDGAAGEGFTNTGDSLVMSPSLLTKYLDAAKEIASHAVLLPDGIRFSPRATRRDWTDEVLADIRRFYAQYADQGGRLSLEAYLAATIECRADLTKGKLSFADAAAQRKLSAKYLESLWEALTATTPSPLLDPLRAAWRAAKPADAPALAAEIRQWQTSLTRFNTVGLFFYTLAGPTVKQSWQEPVDPVVEAQDFRHKFQPAADAQEVILYLTAVNIDDPGAVVVWQQPRLEQTGRPTLFLRDVREIADRLSVQRKRFFSDTTKCLAAAAEARTAVGKDDVATLARRHGVEFETLAAWLDYLGIAAATTPPLVGHYKERLMSAGGYNFIQGWGKLDTPLLVTNSSDQQVRIPGIMKPHSVAVHPSPQMLAVVHWQSPVSANVRLEAKAVHAHPEGGNGLTWALELRRGQGRQRLEAGVIDVAKQAQIRPIEKLFVRRGDVVSLAIGPRDGNHACDLTEIDLTLTMIGGDGRRWNLAAEAANDILAGNPHADRHGNKDVWHFVAEPAAGAGQAALVIPPGSLLDRWKDSAGSDEQGKLAAAMQQLMTSATSPPKDHPNAQLHRQLNALDGPLLSRLIDAAAHALRTRDAPSPNADLAASPFGLNPARFGKLPDGREIDATNLSVSAPAVTEIRLPAALVAGREFVVGGTLAGGAGSVQLHVSTTKPQATSRLLPGQPIVAASGSPARQRVEAALAEFRGLFPAAICYPQIVPVDEVVTLVQYFRDDEALVRLMLDAPQRQKIDRLWDELRYISHDALQIHEAYDQFMEYTTQDRDPKVYKPLRRPIMEQAERFRQRLIETEPHHLNALLDFAARAYRRPLSAPQAEQLRTFYQRLRQEKLPHEEALRLVLARVLASPAFLYRHERAGPGAESQLVSDFELASRLSYFLWATMPDAELFAPATEGKLRNPSVLIVQIQRMLKDSRVRGLATEFACQWIGVREFNAHNEKSERHFPTFVALRDDMYEESVRFFIDLFQKDRSVLAIIDADHTFLNNRLAAHYGIPGIEGELWRRVDGVRKFGRGGVLGMASLLSKQSGASRTSPILRGNWVSETLLGEKLPKPPKNVPQLPEDETALAGMTVRQMTEKHRSVVECAKCHDRIDPFGFAFEGFDAIGRFRTKDLIGQPIDDRVTLPDGTVLSGTTGLRQYLSTQRKAVFVRQFSRKFLGYALGREITLSDEPLLDDMCAVLEKNDGRVASAVESIVRSKQFRYIRGSTVEDNE